MTKYVQQIQAIIFEGAHLKCSIQFITKQINIANQQADFSIKFLTGEEGKPGTIKSVPGSPGPKGERGTRGSPGT